MAIKHWKITEKSVSDLKEHPDNTRKITTEAKRGLRTSLESFGNVELIVWNKRFDRIIGGHQKLKILKEEGQSKTQVIEVDLNKEEEKALMLVLNSRYIAGEFTKETKGALDFIKEKRPDLYSGLMMPGLNKEIEKMQLKVPTKEEEEIIPELEILPYEHWDYILLVFDDSRDWMVALDWFGIKKNVYITRAGHKKIGLGRIIKGKKFLEKIKKDLVNKKKTKNKDGDK